MSEGMQKTLIVNTGSDSHKYALYDGEREICRLHLERDGDKFVANKQPITAEQYAMPVGFVLEYLISQKFIKDKGDISAVGARVVAPGDFFLSNNIIDENYLAEVERVATSAPLHIKPILEEIRQIQEAMPGIKMVGISDSAFHKSLPEVVKRYAITESDSSVFGIYKYGYHGISVASIVRKVAAFGPVPDRVIVCHLGSGSSITAVKNSHSVDTSMGLTPLDGLPMGSRVGSIDPGAVIALGQKKGLSDLELEKYFNTECGLLALSGKTKDVRELIYLEQAGDKKAKLALDSFTYNIKKFIGAYMAVLGGLDLLVFTATIGERSFIMRERICEGLQGLGIILDKTKNNNTVSVDALIHDKKSSVQVAVITTDEMGQIKREMEVIH